MTFYFRIWSYQLERIQIPQAKFNLLENLGHEQALMEITQRSLKRQEVVSLGPNLGALNFIPVKNGKKKLE